MDKQIKGCLFEADFGLFKVYCDFWVICIQDVHFFTVGQLLIVSDVKSTKKGRVVYEIEGSYYYHHNFRLYIKDASNWQFIPKNKQL